MNAGQKPGFLLQHKKPGFLWLHFFFIAVLSWMNYGPETRFF
jgi:hypothetical protein